MIHRLLPLFVIGILLLPLGLQPAQAQSDDGAPVRVRAGDALSVGGLIQADGYAGRESAPDGFRARSVRLRLGGEAKGLSYVIQTDFVRSSVLLDAFAQLPLTEGLQVRAGQFKAPYSAEILTPRPNIRFAERAQVVNAVAPGRQPGVSLIGTLSENVTATVGAFGTRGSDDNDLLQYVGRLNGTTSLGPGELTLGTNVAYDGTQVLLGADAEYTADRWLLAGEVHRTATEPVDPSDISGPTPFSSGFYATGGINVAPNHQVLLRYSYYDIDDTVSPLEADRLSLGYNFDPTSILRLHLTYEAPTDDLADGFATARLQVAL